MGDNARAFLAVEPLEVDRLRSEVSHAPFACPSFELLACERRNPSLRLSLEQEGEGDDEAPSLPHTRAGRSPEDLDPASFNLFLLLGGSALGSVTRGWWIRRAKSCATWIAALAVRSGCIRRAGCSPSVGSGGLLGASGIGTSWAPGPCAFRDICFDRRHDVDRCTLSRREDTILQLPMSKTFEIRGGPLPLIKKSDARSQPVVW